MATTTHSWMRMAEVEKATRLTARAAALRARILGSSGPELRAAILRAIAEVVGGSTLRAVSEALALNDVAAAERAIPWDDVAGIVEPVARIELRSALEQSGQLEARIMLDQLSLGPSAFSFDTTQAAAVNWVRHQSSALTDLMSNSRPGAIRAILDRVMRNGMSEMDAARLLLDGRAIGLTARDALAVANYRAGLRLSGARIDNANTLAARYSRRLLAARAQRIAHEMLVSAHGEGQLVGWAQARADGLIDSRAVVRWNALDDAEEICQGLDGVVVRVGQTFPGGYRRPPDPHVGCRCLLTLHPFGVD